MAKVSPNKIIFSTPGRMVDWEGQVDMRGYELQIEKCPHCEFAEEPNFREEMRVSYRQVGQPGDYGWSTSVSYRQQVLVCLNCGEIARIINEMR